MTPFNVGCAGKPLSILDGIFMAIKDDIDCFPHPSKGKQSLRFFFFFFFFMVKRFHETVSEGSRQL